jgi:hypothetical protein
MNRAINKQSIQNKVMIGTSNIMEKSTAVVGQEPTASQPGKSKWTKFAMLAVVGLVASLLTGCAPGKYTGGGFIDSAAGGKAKATFGFSLEGIDEDGDGQVDVAAVYPPGQLPIVFAIAKGQFNYNDHGAGVQFHLAIVPDPTLTSADGGPLNGCWVVQDPNTGAATGAYCFGPYTSRAGNGEAYVSLTAKGDQYDSAEDTIEVALTGGPYDGYYNSGTIQGGNIQWHPAKAK